MHVRLHADRGGQSYFEEKGDEALNDEISLKSNSGEVSSDDSLKKTNADKALNAE
jgi:hypothetical protein